MSFHRSWRLTRTDIQKDPGRTDYNSFADFRDPDGNTRVLQERGHRKPE